VPSKRCFRSIYLTLLWTVLAMVTTAGCEMFHAPSDPQAGGTKKLPDIRPSADAIELEILYAERPVGDRLLGDPLWRDVDQILDLEPESQRDLARNGFRFGVAGSNPPEALQTLVSLRSDVDSEHTAEEDKKLSGKRIYLRPGTYTYIFVSPTYPECDVTLFPTHESRGSEKKTYEAAQCVYKMTAHRVQEGWVRLEFVPEIRHGIEAMRPNPGPNGWEMSSGQRVEKLYAQTFSLMLNLGEIAVLTARENSAGTVGHRFFVGPEGNDRIQRVMMIRLSHVGHDEKPTASAP
jgi:hypothetical protein